MSNESEQAAQTAVAAIARDFAESMYRMRMLERWRKPRAFKPTSRRGGKRK